MKVKVRRIRTGPNTRSSPLANNTYRPEVPAKLTPSPHGKECLGNGTWLGYECQCDECDFYLTCFPDWKDSSSCSS